MVRDILLEQIEVLARRSSDQMKFEKMASLNRGGTMKKTRFAEEQMVRVLQEANPTSLVAPWSPYSALSGQSPATDEYPL